MEEATQDHLDLLQRQVKIYDLICERLCALRHWITILPYEEMLAEPGIVAQVVGAHATPKAIKFHGEHFAKFYPEI